MKYCHPSFPGHRLGPIKIGSHGLGNLLLIWARAELYAHLHGHSIVWPDWQQIHIGSWVRRASDKRQYGRLFNKPIDSFKSSQIRAIKTFHEKNFSDFEAYAGDAVLKFEGIELGFDPLVGYQKFLWDRLCSMARSNLLSLQNSAKEHIALCIRLGDFKRLGWNTPISWFEARVKELRTYEPKQKVWIFSDGKDEELEIFLRDPLITRAPAWKNPLSSIAQMSGAKGMIATGGSTFYRWGAYLGGMPVIAHSSDDWQAQIWSRISPRGYAYLTGQTPSNREWIEFIKNCSFKE